MKKNIVTTFIVASLGLLLFSCTPPLDDEKKSEGWYVYVSDPSNTYVEQKSVYVYFDTKGDVVRAGNEHWEYEKTALTYFKGLYSGKKKTELDYLVPAQKPNWKSIGFEITPGWYKFQTNETESNQIGYVYINSKGQFAGNIGNNQVASGIYSYLTADNLKTKFKKKDNKSFEFSLDGAETGTAIFVLLNDSEIPDECKKYKYL